MQTKRDTATDITKLLMNAEDLMEVIHDEGVLPLPAGQHVESNMLDDISEEEEDNGQPQQQPLRQLSSTPLPSSASSSSPLSTPAMHIEHRARHGKHRQKHSNAIVTSNHHLNQAQGSSSKLNTMRLFIMTVTLAMASMLLIALKVQNEKQNIDIVKREAQEFHQSARQAIRQAEQRRDMRRVRWGHIEEFVVSIG